MEYSKEIQYWFIDYYWGEKNAKYAEVLVKINNHMGNNPLDIDDIRSLYADLSKNKNLKRIKAQWKSIQARKTDDAVWKLSDFYNWFIKEEAKGCHYCNLQLNQVKDFLEFEKKKKGHKRKNRGKSFEVDRKNHISKYKRKDCILACYMCNNAKSDLYEYDEFLEIGKTIGLETLKILSQVS